MLAPFGLVGLIITGLIIVFGWLSFAYLTVPDFFRFLATILIRLGRRLRWVGFGSL
ncbi:MAG: hypothetical protein MUP45_01705 [Candidatus Marinimicrobia bacterium]|nr:hypothetical protein [Candidatus Neomarinimicrobiota bacterium]